MVGKMGDAEVDFVALKSGQPTYFQVSLSVRDDATLQRELSPPTSNQRPLSQIPTNPGPRPLVLHEGIRQLYALDWLLE